MGGLAWKMIPLWMRSVISLCAAKGGCITAEEIANVAATAGRYGVGWDLVCALRKSRHVSVETIGEDRSQNNQKIKIYRITRRAISVDTSQQSSVTAIR